MTLWLIVFHCEPFVGRRVREDYVIAYVSLVIA